MAPEPFERSAVTRWPTMTRWRADSAGIVASALERWSLEPGEPLRGGEAGSVLTVTTASGEAAVLKVGFPHVEAIGEALALSAWAPDLAPRVLRQEPWVWWMLLERIEPGVPLSSAGLSIPEAARVGGELLARLARTDVPEELPTVGEIVSRQVALAHADSQWGRGLTSGAHEAVEIGLDLASALASEDLGGTGRTDHLVHGDLNPGNVLRAHDRQSGWVVIDPKPMRGNAAYDLEPLVSQLVGAHAGEDLDRRLATTLTTVADAAGVDAELAARWSVARAALEVTWHASEGESRAATQALARLEAWRRISAP